MNDKAQNQQDKDPEFLSTLERGLRVLNVFDREHPEMSLSEVAAAAGLNAAVARRCLNTLVKLGYVRQYGRRFLLLPKMLKFADSFLASTNVELAVTPSLQSLWNETGDSVSMGVRIDDDVICIAHIPSAQAMRPTGNVGTTFPLHATSLGKAILAFLSPDALSCYLQNSRRASFTPSTKAGEAALARDLRKVRKAGFATSDGEYDGGVYAIAVPVLDDKQTIVGSINCSTAQSRSEMTDFNAVRLPLLRQAADQIERDLRRFPMLLRALKT